MKTDSVWLGSKQFFLARILEVLIDIFINWDFHPYRIPTPNSLVVIGGQSFQSLDT